MNGGGLCSLGLRFPFFNDPQAIMDGLLLATSGSRKEIAKPKYGEPNVRATIPVFLAILRTIDVFRYVVTT